MGRFYYRFLEVKELVDGKINEKKMQSEAQASILINLDRYMKMGSSCYLMHNHKVKKNIDDL